jgi:hypothetical protein
LGLCLGACGCFEIETKIEVHEDGSATITERVRFSQKLLDLDRTRTDGPSMASLLSREAVEERMKRMGEGIRLESHEVRDADGASRESAAVFRIDDVGKFRYVSPFFAVSEYAQHSGKRPPATGLPRSHFGGGWARGGGYESPEWGCSTDRRRARRVALASAR